jgi:two-component system, OmpR family, sensor histidine kinase ArlS
MVGVLSVLWISQIVLLSSNFKDMKINQVKQVADHIERSIIDNEFNVGIQIAAVQNNVCGLVYNTRGVLLYQVDALGLGCVLNQSAIGFNQKIQEYSMLIDQSPSQDFSLLVYNSVIQQDMIVYGRRISLPFGAFDIYLNSTLLPVNSTITILQEQFIYVTFFVFVLFSLVSLFISSRISKPIVKMNQSALKLAKGNYHVTFEPGEFTEFKDLADTLNYTSQELKRMDELRRDLIANVSHDIKTPLTIIKAYAEMIKDLSGDNPHKRSEHLQVILNEASHLDQLVQDMTQLSQLQSNVLQLNISDFDVVELIHETLHLLEGMMQNAQVNLTVYAPQEVWVSGDRLKLKQVLMNFISNGIKFMGEDHQLIVQVLLEESGVVVEVIDHGEGIDESDLPYIWDRYYKIDKNYQRNTTGTGLGLSIASAILKRHAYEFGVHSVLNEGTTFWFKLPYVDSSQKEI